MTFNLLRQLEAKLIIIYFCFILSLDSSRILKIVNGYLNDLNDVQSNAGSKNMFSYLNIFDTEIYYVILFFQNIFKPAIQIYFMFFINITYYAKLNFLDHSGV